MIQPDRISSECANVIIIIIAVVVLVVPTFKFWRLTNFRHLLPRFLFPVVPRAKRDRHASYQSLMEAQVGTYLALLLTQQLIPSAQSMRSRVEKGVQ